MKPLLLKGIWWNKNTISLEWCVFHLAFLVDILDALIYILTNNWPICWLVVSQYVASSRPMVRWYLTNISRHLNWDIKGLEYQLSICQPLANWLWAWATNEKSSFYDKSFKFFLYIFFISVMFESKRIKASRQPLTSFDDFMCWNTNWRSQWWSFSSKTSIFFLNNYLTIQWLWEIINSINYWVAIKKMFSQIFTDYKDEIYADDLQEGWKFIGRKKVRHPSY